MSRPSRASRLSRASRAMVESLVAVRRRTVIPHRMAMILLHRVLTMALLQAASRRVAIMPLQAEIAARAMGTHLRATEMRIPMALALRLPAVFRIRREPAMGRALELQADRPLRRLETGALLGASLAEATAPVRLRVRILMRYRDRAQRPAPFPLRAVLLRRALLS